MNIRILIFGQNRINRTNEEANNQANKTKQNNKTKQHITDVNF